MPGIALGRAFLSPSLRGLELVDDADAVTRAYGSPPPWDGLALLDEAFVPHYRSPGHPETAAIERVVTRYRAEGIAYRALHDGQALLVNGPETKIV
jgi:dipeptidase E